MKGKKKTAINKKKNKRNETQHKASNVKRAMEMLKKNKATKNQIDLSYQRDALR